MSEQSGSWQPDPFGRHQHRWWDGTSWTDQVSDDGVTSVDPPGDAPAAPGPATAATPGAAASASPSKGGSSNVVGFVIGGVVLLALLAGAAYFLLGGDDDDEGDLAEYLRSEGAPAEEAECMASELGGDMSADRFRALTEGDAEPTAAEGMAMLSAVSECSLGDLDLDMDDIASEEGDTYGDNPTLDALWDACEDGDGEACDDLYFQSPVGSEYEEFGDTCGGRFEPGEVLCSNEDLD